MANYKIVTDSCCDFTKQQYADFDLTYVPLTLLHKGEALDSFTEPADLKAFYDDLRAGEMPTTFQSAVIAADELREKYPERTINVVDTLCAALGQGLLVWYACQKRDAGATLEELTAWVEENRFHICHEVTVNDLNHLKRGGRVSATTALVGSMLNIKPMIHVSDEGKLVNYSKVRGRKAAMEQIIKMFEQKGAGYDNETVFIAHGDCPADAAELEKLLRAKHPEVKNVLTGYVGGVIGAHTGPGVLVLFFMGGHR